MQIDLEPHEYRSNQWSVGRSIRNGAIIGGLFAAGSMLQDYGLAMSSDILARYGGAAIGGAVAGAIAFAAIALFRNQFYR
jgi:hypothetical protein